MFKKTLFPQLETNFLFHPLLKYHPQMKIRWESHSPWRVSKDIPDMPIERLLLAPHSILEVPSNFFGGHENPRNSSNLRAQLFETPIVSMYGIFSYFYHKNQPNVGIYTIHGSYGTCINRWFTNIVFNPYLRRWALYAKNILQVAKKTTNYFKGFTKITWT